MRIGLAPPIGFGASNLLVGVNIEKPQFCIFEVRCCGLNGADFLIAEESQLSGIWFELRETDVGLKNLPRDRGGDTSPGSACFCVFFGATFVNDTCFTTHYDPDIRESSVPFGHNFFLHDVTLVKPSLSPTSPIFFTVLPIVTFRVIGDAAHSLDLIKIRLTAEAALLWPSYIFLAYVYCVLAALAKLIRSLKSKSAKLKLIFKLKP